MSAHVYWRLKLNTIGPGGSGYVINEVGFCTTVGGGSVTTGGTAFESSHFSGFVAANAFDGSDSTIWAAASGSNTEYIGYQFASAVNIVDMFIRSDPSFFTQAPVEGVLEYSDDGTNYFVSTFWITGTWSALQTQRFTPPSSNTLASYGWWGVLPLATASLTGYVIDEIGFCATLGGSTQTSGGTARVTSGEVFSSHGANLAFDANTATVWASIDKVVGQAITYAFASPVVVEQMYLESTDGGSGNGTFSQMPTDWLVIYSSDGITFAVAWAVSGVTWGSNLQTQRFNNPAVLFVTVDMASPMEFRGSPPVGGNVTVVIMNSG